MDFLIKFYPVLLNAVLWSIIVLLISKLPKLIKYFKKIKWTTWIILFFILATSLYIRLEVIPSRHILYYDEIDHLSLANKIYYSNSYCECHTGEIDDCLPDNCSLKAWPPGYHVLLSNVFKILGNENRIGQLLNVTLNLLTIFVFFLITYLKTKKEYLALAAAFFSAGIPVFLKFSGTTILGLNSVFFTLLSLFLLEIYLRDKQYSTLIILLLSTIYAIYSRPENFLLLGIIPLYWVLQIDLKKEVKSINWTRLATILIFSLMLIPLFIHYNNNSNEGWEDSISKKIEFAKDHIPININFFLNYKTNPVPLFILSLIGILNIFSKKRLKIKNTIKHVIFFGTFFILYSIYHIGEFINSGTRYTLILYIPIIFLAIEGITIISNKIPRTYDKLLSVVLCIIFATSLIPTFGFILDGEYHSENEPFILSISKLIPNDAWVIAPSPASIMILAGMKSTSYEYYHFRFQKMEQNIFLLTEEELKNDKYNYARIENNLSKIYNTQLIKSNGQMKLYNLTLKTQYMNLSRLELDDIFEVEKHTIDFLMPPLK